MPVPYLMSGGSIGLIEACGLSRGVRSWPVLSGVGRGQIGKTAIYVFGMFANRSRFPFASLSWGDIFPKSATPPAETRMVIGKRWWQVCTFFRFYSNLPPTKARKLVSPSTAETLIPSLPAQTLQPAFCRYRYSPTDLTARRVFYTHST